MYAVDHHHLKQDLLQQIPNCGLLSMKDDKVVIKPYIPQVIMLKFSGRGNNILLRGNSHF